MSIHKTKRLPALFKREQGQASARSIRAHTLSLVYVHVQIERSKIVPYKDQADEVEDTLHPSPC